MSYYMLALVESDVFCRAGLGLLFVREVRLNPEVDRGRSAGATCDNSIKT